MPGKNKKDDSGKKARLELLKGISGAAVPGQLTALMGGSGAGKVSTWTQRLEVLSNARVASESNRKPQCQSISLHIWATLTTISGMMLHEAQGVAKAI